MDQVREELQELLRADFAPPGDLSDCPELLDLLRGELSGRLEKGEDADRFALALVFEAALQPGPNGRPNRDQPTFPLRAAKHLLALGDYPEDVHSVVPDTRMTLAEIKNMGTEAPVQESNPRGSNTLRLRAQIALAASNTGRVRGVLTKKGSFRRAEAASALWNQIEDLLREKDLITILRSRVEWMEKMQAEGAASETAPLPAHPPDRPAKLAEVDLVARRRKIGRRLRRRALSRALDWLRHGHRLNGILAAVLVVGVLTAAFTVLHRIDRTSDIDPLDARAAGEGWDPGFGPSSDVRLEQSPSGLLINRSGEWPTRGSFVRVLHGGSEVNGEIPPGEYTLVVDVGVREPRSGDASTVPADELTSATAWIGTTRVANQTTGFSYAVFARIAADDTATVWSGAGLVMLCGCTVGIEPGSVRLYSDTFPNGTPVDDSILTTGARIGYAGDDGILRAGRDYDLRLTATLLIEERTWLPRDEGG